VQTARAFLLVGFVMENKIVLTIPTSKDVDSLTMNQTQTKRHKVATNISGTVETISAFLRVGFAMARETVLMVPTNKDVATFKAITLNLLAKMIIGNAQTKHAS
jgi:hypothetical protein